MRRILSYSSSPERHSSFVIKTQLCLLAKRCWVQRVFAFFDSYPFPRKWQNSKTEHFWKRIEHILGHSTFANGRMIHNFTTHNLQSWKSQNQYNSHTTFLQWLRVEGLKYECWFRLVYQGISRYLKFLSTGMMKQLSMSSFWSRSGQRN